MSTRRILVTSALPYANGHIHIGHLVEYIQTDIWVRFQKLRGHRCVYMCADDTHGTAIMIRARQEGRSEEELIAEMRKAHLADFGGFDIRFDNYGSTNSAENRDLCRIFWSAFRKAGLVIEQDVTQLFDVQAGTFLADRFVKGTCPKCQSGDQYGDNCDKCGSTYSPVDLIDPISTLSGTKPELRTARHLFVRIENLHAFLNEWTQCGQHLQPEVANFLKNNFLSEPLRDWDISRPLPYFGFEIPDSPGNCWYVWFDAPIGYIASTTEWCAQNNETVDSWWKSSDTEIHHFIGKDITYFHTLFWPSMLKTAEYSLPTKVHIHGFLTVNGEKMSKSKGTFVNASTYLAHLDPSYLRYYYASKLTPRLDDLDLSLEEFASRVNADLVGKVVNLASRTARLVESMGLSSRYPEDQGLFAEAAARGEELAGAYESCDFAAVTRTVMALADRANRYLDEAAPWSLKKDPAKAGQLQDVCSIALNLFRQISLYLAPILPKLAQQAGELLNRPIERWEESGQPLVGTPVSPFRHMMKRVEAAQVRSMIEASAEAPSTEPVAPASVQDGPEALAAEPLAQTISFDEFSKIDLRVARILAAEDVKEAAKLLKLTISLGGHEQRTVFAGIKGVYEPSALVNRLVIVCANLAPRKMKFGLSEGMILAAGPGAKEIFLLSPDSGAVPGQRVH